MLFPFRFLSVSFCFSCSCSWKLNLKVNESRVKWNAWLRHLIIEKMHSKFIGKTLYNSLCSVSTNRIERSFSSSFLRSQNERTSSQSEEWPKVRRVRFSFGRKKFLIEVESRNRIQTIFHCEMVSNWVIYFDFEIGTSWLVCRLQFSNCRRSLNVVPCTSEPATISTIEFHLKMLCATGVVHNETFRFQMNSVNKLTRYLNLFCEFSFRLCL